MKKHHLRISMADQTFCGLEVTESNAINRANPDVKTFFLLPEKQRCKKCEKAIG